MRDHSQLLRALSLDVEKNSILIVQAGLRLSIVTSNQSFPGSNATTSLSSSSPRWQVSSSFLPAACRSSRQRVYWSTWRVWILFDLQPEAKPIHSAALRDQTFARIGQVCVPRARMIKSTGLFSTEGCVWLPHLSSPIRPDATT